MFLSSRKFAALLAAIVLVSGFVVTSSTLAAEYVIEPSVGVLTSYDNNLLLNTNGREIKTFILELSPRLRARMSSDKWQAAFDGTISAVRLEDDDFDSDNQDISLQLTRRTETVMFQVAALNSRQSTRRTELDELGEIGFDVERRDRQYLRPSLTWTLNATNRLAFGVSGENVHYGGLQFSDYDYYSADIAWTHQIDEKTQFSLTTFGSEYLSGPPVPRTEILEGCPDVPLFPGFPQFGSLPLGAREEFNSDTVGLQIGASRQPSSRFSYRGSLGYRSVDTTSAGRCSAPGQESFSDATSSEGFVLDTGMTYQGEKYGVDFSISRSVSPAGLGFLTERDSVNLDVSYRYSEQITLGLLVNGFNTESIDDELLYEREGLRIVPRIDWRLTQKLNLSGGLRFRSNESLTAPGGRDGINAFISFNYRFKPTTLSR